MDRKTAPLLLETGILTPEEFAECLEEARHRNVSVLEVMIEDKQVSEESLAEAFASRLKLPRVRLASVTFEPEALNVISPERARKHLCLPFKIEGKSLLLAMANPADYDAIQVVQFASGLTVRPVVASRSEILDGIQAHYATGDQLGGFLANVTEASDFQVVAPTDFEIVATEKEEVELDFADSQDAANLAPVVKMCNLLIHAGVEKRSSDIHIEPGVNAVQVRLRVDGVLRDYMQIPKWLHHALVSRLKILAKMDIAERRLPQDGRIKVQMQGKPLDLRVSTLPTYYGEKMVLRILGATGVPTFQEMGYTDEQRVILEIAATQPQGLILVTGPTGSGKTTSLYAAANFRLSPEVNIITVEDPIEYMLPGINQVQVNNKAGLTFATCLRSILRQDPDVILVGEIRDLETAEIAFHAAMTGHMVFSTLHTNSSLATITRLLDLGLDPFLVASSVNLIIAQRLARRICAKCKEQYTPSSGLLTKVSMEEPEAVFYRGRGCPACGQTGYAGRVGIYEILRMTPSIKELIHKKAPEMELRKAAGLAGTRFLLDDAMDKVRQGITTVEEVLRVIQLQEEEIISCPKCKALIEAAFTTCPYCLYTLRYLCRSCGQDLKQDWRICPYCNTRVPEEFQVELPQPAPAGAPEKGDAPLGSTPSHKGPRELAPVKKPYIMVVDDDEGIRKLVQKTLATQIPLEVEVATASDGAEALERAETRPPDLMILDIMMPRMDGFTVCQRLREDVRTAFIPVLMLTAKADEKSWTQAFLMGTDDYISKPFRVPEFVARVKRLLRRAYGL